MEIEFCRSTTIDELNQILELQRKNLYNNVSEVEQVQEGFVTVVHTYVILKKMNDVCPHIIAKEKNKVIGYALSMHPKFSNEIPVLKPMFEEIKKIIPKNEKYLAMGQICIDKVHRKRGVFRKLYETMKITAQSEFDSIITEVDAKNIRSLNAHYAVGFTHLKTYYSGGRDWAVISLKT
jgi:predicted GNAT family N-acyltransferase